jgi:hypothetical protein
MMEVLCRRLPRSISRFLSGLVVWITLLTPIQSYPLPIRSVDSIISIDPSQDAWSDSLSGVGPLILLIGERATKQLLRNIRGPADAFSLAAAPLGLLSVVTSLIRLCGFQRLRAFIGYELEARAVAAIEMTRVNCGGVHAEIVDGYIARTAASNPMSQAIAVSLLQGSLSTTARDALFQIEMCNIFEDNKRNSSVPDNVGAVRWVLQIVSTGDEDILFLVETLLDAISCGQVPDSQDEAFQRFCESLMIAGGSHNCGEKDQFRCTRTTSKLHEGSKTTTTHYNDKPAQVLELDESIGGPSTHVEIIEKQKGALELVRSISSASEHRISRGNTLTQTATKSSTTRFQSASSNSSSTLNFMCSLDAVSEYATTTPTLSIVALLLALTSFFAIWAVYITALWQNNWNVSAAWLLVVIGYLGIVLSVLAAALIIHSTCACIKLGSRSTSESRGWTHGLVVSVKNTDSVDTTGSDLMKSRSGALHFEVVWVKDLTGKRRLAASVTAVGLVLFFVCHYLGLRSSRWWVSIGELLVCLLAAVARSATKDHQEKFSLAEGIKIDKRCSSTGIIQTQKAERVENSSKTPRRIDARAYSTVSLDFAPTNAEAIAWRTAQLCVPNELVASEILRVTGMQVHIARDVLDPNFHAVLASYSGGLLVTEGLASPNARLLTAFRCKTTDLAKPTSLLARAAMRQPEWILDDYAEFAKGIPLGNVHIPGINSIIDWWTVSEDRNDLGDLGRNLQWTFSLVNIAFFLALLRLGEGTRVVDAVEKIHGGMSESTSAVAGEVAHFLHERSKHN